ncbi:MAG: L,D-transpeptidase Cds6 family protein [Rhodoferax sp.]
MDRPAAPIAAPETAAPGGAGTAATGLAAPVPEDPSSDVEATVRAWAKSWSERDVAVYLAAYGADFALPPGLSRKAWEEGRRLRIVGKASISVRLEGLKIVVVGDNRAQAKFLQDYRGGALAIRNSKTLDLARIGDTWFIVKESAGN